MIEAFGKSDTGVQRKNNEDTLLLSEEAQFYLVADGMGGHRSGELASARAAELISEFILQTRAEAEITWPFGYRPNLSLNANRLVNALQLANAAIWRQADREPDHHGMGTTVVCTLIHDRTVTFVSAGDSRLYLVRNGSLRQLTQDDSWANSFSELAEDLQEFRHVLTKAVGVSEDLEISPAELILMPDDYLLLSTDGLHSVVPGEELSRFISAPNRSLQEKVKLLIQRANELGGPDNVTALLLHYREP